MSSVRLPSLVLVTGASQGIGAEIARLLAGAGCGVLVSSRRLAACEEVVAQIEAGGGRAWPLTLDVGAADSIAAACQRVREIVAENGPLEGLVNNAGIAVSSAFARNVGSDQDLVDRHLAVNFQGPRRLMEALVPPMVERGYGQVVNVASSAGLRGYGYVSAYCASKHALVGYSLAVSEEVLPAGVCIDLVCPHYVDSPMLAESVRRVVDKTGQSEDEVRAFFRAANPGGAFVTPRQVAEVTLATLGQPEGGRIVELDGSPEPHVYAGNSRLAGQE